MKKCYACADEAEMKLKNVFFFAVDIGSVCLKICFEQANVIR